MQATQAHQEPHPGNELLIGTGSASRWMRPLSTRLSLKLAILSVVVSRRDMAICTLRNTHPTCRPPAFQAGCRGFEPRLPLFEVHRLFAG